MILDDLNKIIQQGEGLKIEFKEAVHAVPKNFYETVASFSNTDGGTILLGVDDKGNVKGVDADALAKIQKDVVSALNTRDFFNPPLYLQPFVINHPKGDVIVVQVPASSQVHDYAGRIYTRQFESDLDITDNQQKVGELYLRKRNFFSEAKIYPHLTMEDLDPLQFTKARQLIRNFRSDHPWLLVGDEQMLKDSVLWRKDFNTGEEGLTLAAALIFGKDTTIQSMLPAYKVEAMVRIENKDRWDDRINPPLRTNLIDTYLGLKDFINKHLPEKFFTEGDQRVDLRDRIFREVIGNVIVHREYSSALSTEMIISAQSVIITNPNKPLFHGPIDPRGFNPYPKNPNIRKFFTAFGWTDEIGSGIRNTSKYLPFYSRGAAPLFWENDVFKTEIPLQKISMADYGGIFASWLELPEESWLHVEKGMENIALAPELAGADWQTVLLDLVPSWHQKGTQLTALNWAENQIHTKSEIEKIPGWHQKGTQLLTKKAGYYISILVLTSEPMQLNEIMRLMNYKNEKTFRDNYIKPLRATGLISLTNPEKPTAPDNKYRITEAGKVFLGGL